MQTVSHERKIIAIVYDGRSGDLVQVITGIARSTDRTGATMLGLTACVSKEFGQGEEYLADLVTRIQGALINRGIRTVNASIDPENPLKVNFDYAGSERLDSAIRWTRDPYFEDYGYTQERIQELIVDAIAQRDLINKAMPEILSEEDKRFLKEYELFYQLKKIIDLPQGTTILNFRETLPEDKIADAQKHCVAYRVMSSLGINDTKFKEKYTRAIGTKYDDLLAIFGTWVTDFTAENIMAVRTGKKTYLPNKDSSDAKPYSMLVAIGELKEVDKLDDSELSIILDKFYGQKEDRLPNRNPAADETYAIDLLPKFKFGLARDIFFMYHPLISFDKRKKEEFLEQIAENHCAQLDLKDEDIKEKYQKAMLLTINTVGITKAIDLLVLLEGKIQKNKWVDRDDSVDYLKRSEFYFSLVRDSYDTLSKQDPVNKRAILRLKKTVEKAYFGKFKQIKELCIDNGLLPGYGYCEENILKHCVRTTIKKYATKFSAALRLGKIVLRGDLEGVLSAVKEMRPKEKKYKSYSKYETVGSLLFNYLKGLLQPKLPCQESTPTDQIFGHQV